MSTKRWEDLTTEERVAKLLKDAEIFKGLEEDARVEMVTNRDIAEDLVIAAKALSVGKDAAHPVTGLWLKPQPASWQGVNKP